MGYRYPSPHSRSKNEFTTYKFRYSNYLVFYHHPYLCYQNDRFYSYGYHWGNGTHCSSSYQYLDIPARKSYNKSYYRSATHYHCSNDRYFKKKKVELHCISTFIIFLFYFSTISNSIGIRVDEGVFAFGIFYH